MTLPLKQTIGIIGGGQLGKMLIEASRPWNFRNIVLENDASCPAAAVADAVIIGRLDEAAKIRELAAQCDVLTYEIEHVGVDTLLELEAEGKTIIPAPGVLKIIGDKGLQKTFYRDHKLPTTPFVLVNEAAHWQQAIQVLRSEKLVAKLRTGGYDGRGVDVFSREHLATGNYQPAFDAPVVIEEFVEEATELAIIVACDREGNVCCWPAIQMEFHPVANLVEFLYMPADVDEHLEKLAGEIAMQAVKVFNSPGVFAVELLIDKEENVWINEIAPRPHNSGHHTIEACITSQYEQLNRILAGFPLGDTKLIAPAAMVNLLGPEVLEGSWQLAGAEEVLAIPGVYIHLYNKQTIKPFRKMGHVTVLGDSAGDVHRNARKVLSVLKFVQG
jgi:5-(carboxyamino)imidazole ribonucleotide synthase